MWWRNEIKKGQDGYFCSKCGYFVPWEYKKHPKSDDAVKDIHTCPRCKSKIKVD
jgi:DNA-directed RNA polymerase subunit RPC12/RpoP